MAWTAPMTAVANAVFTAAQFNAHVRDNLLETAPAKATAEGTLFVGTGTNAIAERTPSTATVSTSQTTTSTSYTDLTTVGPEVTVNTGTKAIVLMAAQISNNSASQNAVRFTYAVSGASTIAAADARSFRYEVAASDTKPERVCMMHMETGLTAGSNTFTMKYRVSGTNTGTFSDRHLVVIPL